MADRVEERARERLEAYGVEVELDARLSGGSRTERVWRLRTGGQTVLVLAMLLPEAEWPIAGRAAPGSTEEEELPRLWYADYIAPQRAAYLRTAGQHYIDTVGNVHLRLPPLVLEVQGKAPTRKRRGKKSARRLGAAVSESRTDVVRVWRGAALRLLFQLLCNPTLAERPQREVARLTGCAPGTVMLLYQDLRLLGNLVPLGGKRQRFAPDRALRDRWIVEYGQKLRPKLLLQNFEIRDLDRWKSFDASMHDALWGAESAAQRLGADLVPGIETLYVHEIRASLLKAAGLRASPGGRVELRQAFWGTPACASPLDQLHTNRPATDPLIRNGEPSALTPTLLVVADLMATRDGRCQAAAEMILNNHLDGPVPLSSS